MGFHRLQPVISPVGNVGSSPLEQDHMIIFW